jgi:uncharacterized protein (TIGR02453 family)
VTGTGFSGFTHEGFQFLVDLTGNNERSWFQPRKADYERLLKEPLEELCVALQERFGKRDIPLQADPKRSPFRIYRDTRFSKDKSPYKTNIGADFPWAEPGPDGSVAEMHAHSAGGYFHLSVAESFVGGGMWHPEPAKLAAFRRAVVDEPTRVHAAIDEPGFVKRFGHVNGEQLKRVPTGFPADHPDVELLRLKDVVFGRVLKEKEIFSPKLPDILADDFEAAIPVYRFLAGLAPVQG